MFFDESDSKITDHLCGKEILHVVRKGKVLEFHSVCGHVIKLQACINGDIHFRGLSVNIILPHAFASLKQSAINQGKI